MKKEKFFELIGDIDEKHIVAARREGAKRRIPFWARWAAAAACVCLVAVTALSAIADDTPETVVHEDKTYILLKSQFEALGYDVKQTSREINGEPEDGIEYEYTISKDGKIRGTCCITVYNVYNGNVSGYFCDQDCAAMFENMKLTSLLYYEETIYIDVEAVGSPLNSG